MRVPRRLTTIAATGTLALAAVGCVSEAGPGPAPSTRASRSATSKPSKPTDTTSHTSDAARASGAPAELANPKKPTRADFPKIDDHTDAGAAAALDFFVAGYRYGLLTGDPSVLEAMSSSSCAVCQRLVKNVEDPTRRLSKADWEFDETRVHIVSSARVETFTHISSTTTLAATERTQSQSIYIGAVMNWDGERWTAVDASVEAE